jgi:GNAT superfamily N-acetyltransferase
MVEGKECTLIHDTNHCQEYSHVLPAQTRTSSPLSSTSIETVTTPPSVAPSTTPETKATSMGGETRNGDENEWGSVRNILGFGQIDFSEAEKKAHNDGAATSSSPSNDGIAELGALYIHPNAIRLGIGRQIMTLLLNEARRRHAMHTGVTSIRLDASVNGLPFYESCGFKRDGPTKTHFFGGTSPPIGVESQPMIYKL